MEKVLFIGRLLGLVIGLKDKMRNEVIENQVIPWSPGMRNRVIRCHMLALLAHYHLLPYSFLIISLHIFRVTQNCQIHLSTLGSPGRGKGCFSSYQLEFSREKTLIQVTCQSYNSMTFWEKHSSYSELCVERLGGQGGFQRYEQSMQQLL